MNEGRTTTGYFRSSTAARASSIVCTMWDRADSPPARSTTPLNSSRFSPSSMASMFAPISSTPKRSSTPSLSRAMAVFSAVWPPRVGSRASGRSFSMILATTAGVMGST